MQYILIISTPHLLPDPPLTSLPIQLCILFLLYFLFIGSMGRSSSHGSRNCVKGTGNQRLCLVYWVRGTAGTHSQALSMVPQGKVLGVTGAWRLQLGSLNLTSSVYRCSKEKDDSLLIRVEIQMDNFPLPPSTRSTSKIVHKILSESLELSPAQLNLILSRDLKWTMKLRELTLSGFMFPPFSDPRN